MNQGSRSSLYLTPVEISPSLNWYSMIETLSSPLLKVSTKEFHRPRQKALFLVKRFSCRCDGTAVRYSTLPIRDSTLQSLLHDCVRTVTLSNEDTALYSFPIPAMIFGDYSVIT